MSVAVYLGSLQTSCFCILRSVIFMLGQLRTITASKYEFKHDISLKSPKHSTTSEPLSLYYSVISSQAVAVAPNKEGRAGVRLKQCKLWDTVNEQCLLYTVILYCVDAGAEKCLLYTVHYLVGGR